MQARRFAVRPRAARASDPASIARSLSMGTSLLQAAILEEQKYALLREGPPRDATYSGHPDGCNKSGLRVKASQQRRHPPCSQKPIRQNV